MKQANRYDIRNSTSENIVKDMAPSDLLRKDSFVKDSERISIRKIDWEYSVADLLVLWQKSLAGSVRPSTYSTYAYLMENVLIPSVGGRRAEDFDGQAMAEFLAECRQRCRRGGACLSDSTLYLLEVILHRAFLHAVGQGLLSRNPLGKMRTRPCRDAEVAPLAPEAVALLKRELAPRPALARLEVLLPLYTGCILSELCALSWEEVDLGHGRLRIRKNLLRVKDAKGEGGAKTALRLTDIEPKCQRTVYIPSVLKEELSCCREGARQKDAYLLTGKSTYLDPRTYQKHVRATLMQCGFEDGSLTVLRDTYVAMCLECGAGEYSLARQLGIGAERLITRYQEYLQPDYDFVNRLK